MRKILSMWMACAVLFGIVAITAPAARGEDAPAEEMEQADGEEALGEETEQSAGEASVRRYALVNTKKGTLNLRKTASKNGKVTGRLPNQVTVAVLAVEGDWIKVHYGTKTGYVMASYLTEVEELPFETLQPGDKGDEVKKLKQQLKKLGYLQSKQVNDKYDAALEKALQKLQLLNGFPQTAVADADVQAFVFWGKVMTDKSGYSGTATDEVSGLTASIFCWDSGGMLYEEDQAVRVKISFVTQVSGGQPPYDITVQKAVSSRADTTSGDDVKSPFTYVWKNETGPLYLLAIVEDADGNTVTARARFNYTLPARYRDNGID